MTDGFVRDLTRHGLEAGQPVCVPRLVCAPLTGGCSKQRPSAMSRQTLVDPSLQPPRNQAWLTDTAGSSTAAMKAPSAQARSRAAAPQSWKLRGAGLMPWGLFPRAVKFLAEHENTGSSGRTMRLVKRYASATTARTPRGRGCRGPGRCACAQGGRAQCGELQRLAPGQRVRGGFPRCGERFMAVNRGGVQTGYPPTGPRRCAPVRRGARPRRRTPAIATAPAP